MFNSWAKWSRWELISLKAISSMMALIMIGGPSPKIWDPCATCKMGTSNIRELRHPGHKEITVTCSLAPILLFIDPILIDGIYYMKIRSRRWAWDSVATRWTCRTRRRTHDLPSFCVKWWVVELVVKNLGAFLFWRPCAIAHLAHARRRPCMIAYLCWTGLQIFSSENFTLMRPLRQKLSQLLEEAQKQTPYTGGNTIPVYKFTVHPLFYVYINENRGMPTIDSMSPWWGTLHYVPWQKGQNDHLLWGPWGWGQLKFLVDTKSSMRLAPMWEIIEPQDEKSNFASCSTTWWHGWNQLPNKIHAIVRTSSYHDSKNPHVPYQHHPQDKSNQAIIASFCGCSHATQCNPIHGPI